MKRDDLVAAARERGDDVRTDEAGRADDQNAHAFSVERFSLWFSKWLSKKLAEKATPEAGFASNAP